MRIGRLFACGIVSWGMMGSAAAQAPPTAPAPVSATGFALEVRLDMGQRPVDDDFVLGTFSPGVSLGYRARSVIVGLGFELIRLASSSSSPFSESGRSQTNVMVIPGVQVAMARSAHGASELFGALDVGYGTFSFSSDEPASDPPTVRQLRLQVGPGVRHWITPAFAIGAAAGIRYDRTTSSRSVDGMDSSSTFAATFMFGSVRLTGVF